MIYHKFPCLQNCFANYKTPYREIHFLKDICLSFPQKSVFQNTFQMTRKGSKCKGSMDLVDSLRYSFTSLKNDNNPPGHFSVDISKLNTIFMGVFKKHIYENILEQAFLKNH